MSIYNIHFAASDISDSAKNGPQKQKWQDMDNKEAVMVAVFLFAM